MAGHAPVGGKHVGSQLEERRDDPILHVLETPAIGHAGTHQLHEARGTGIVLVRHGDVDGIDELSGAVEVALDGPPPFALLGPALLARAVSGLPRPPAPALCVPSVVASGDTSSSDDHWALGKGTPEVWSG